MAIQQNPLPGYRYVNQAGQLMKVRALLYDKGELSKVMIDYLDGVMRVVDFSDWWTLDVEAYIPTPEEQQEAWEI